MKRSLPIGISDFRKVMENDYYYIDKSLLIKELLDSGSETVLLLRPRRFGKTLNLSMLRYFFEKSDADGSAWFRDLAIWRAGEAYTRHQGQYPVIFLTFKDVKCDSWQECYGDLCRVIGAEYERHAYVLESEDLQDHDRKRFASIVDGTADRSEYRYSLKQLSVWLERHHGRRAFVLIDEYDTPIQQGFLHDYYDDVIGLMRSLLGSALKDNSSLERGVLTGILRVAKESIFSGLNNVTVCTLLDAAYSAHFGLLEPEVEALLADYEVGLDAEQIKAWYNGYRFGNATVYNPWSMLNVAAAWESGFRPYWVNTSGNDLIRLLLTRSDGEVKADMERLLQGESIRKEINDNVSFRDVDRHADALWSFLLFSGYVKIVSREQHLRLYGELMIPNREVEYLFEEIVIDWFREHIGENHRRMMLNALVQGDIGTFGDMFHYFVEHTFSVFDVGGQHPERVYHAFVLGLLVGLQDRYEVKSNRESGFGRYDVMLIPRGGKGKGVVVEFKRAKRGETLEEAAAAALRQIGEKRYAAELEERGVSDIVRLGIAFAGKDVLIREGG